MALSSILLLGCAAMGVAALAIIVGSMAGDWEALKQWWNQR